MSKVRPGQCKFCGSLGRKPEQDPEDPGFVVSCRNEKCGAEYWANTPEAAIAGWNASPKDALEPKKGEAIFVIRVGGPRTQLRTKADEIDPRAGIEAAISVLQDEMAGLDACPFHKKAAA